MKKKLLTLLYIGLLTFLLSGTVYAQNEPVWPGTQTRFYPGIYPRADGVDMTAEDVSLNINKWWNGRNPDNYREYYNGHRVSHLGLMIMITTNSIYSEYWNSQSVAPYDYKTSCSNSTLMQNPDAVVDGQPVYDWSVLESILALPQLESGDFKIIIRHDDQKIKAKHPKWWETQGMLSADLQHPLKYDWIYSRCKMDFMKAMATKFAGNTKIAAIQFSEFAGLTNEVTRCGYVVPDQNWQISAENGTYFYPAKAMLEADPGILLLKGNIAAFVPVYFTGKGSGLGLDDLPGCQGGFHADPRFFRETCGNGEPCSIDCVKKDYGSFWFYQMVYANKKDFVVAMCTERNGWYVDNSEGARTGSKNPWNVNEWPDEGEAWNGSKPGGDAMGDATSMFPDPAFWVWYSSGPPKAEGNKANSGLGQIGTDPCGVIPSHMYIPTIPYWIATAADAPDGEHITCNAENLSMERFFEGFDLFGPSGTQAMFAYPDGYLEQFTSNNINSKENVGSFNIFPNPASEEIRFEFEIVTRTEVSINIFNLKGQLISTLINDVLDPVKQTLKFETYNLDPGIYVCQFRNQSITENRKLIVFRD